MRGRHCNRYAPHELAMLRAANSLPKSDRRAACRDIAEITGRWAGAVQTKADRIRTKPNNNHDWLAT